MKKLDLHTPFTKREQVLICMMLEYARSPVQPPAFDWLTINHKIKHSEVSALFDKMLEWLSKFDKEVTQ